MYGNNDSFVIVGIHNTLPVRIPLATMGNDVIDLNQSTISHVTDASLSFIFDHDRPRSTIPRKFSKLHSKYGNMQKDLILNFIKL